jgi:hypothetical protein
MSVYNLTSIRNKHRRINDMHCLMRDSILLVFLIHSYTAVIYKFLYIICPSSGIIFDIFHYRDEVLSQVEDIDSLDLGPFVMSNIRFLFSIIFSELLFYFFFNYDLFVSLEYCVTTFVTFSCCDMHVLHTSSISKKGNMSILFQMNIIKKLVELAVWLQNHDWFELRKFCKVKILLLTVKQQSVNKYQ